MADGPSQQDRTVIMPTPGGTRMQQAPAPAPPAAPSQAPSQAPAQAPSQALSQASHSATATETAPLSAYSGRNPLLAAASELFALVRQLRNSPNHPDPQQLRRDIVDQVRSMEAQARRSGIPNQHIQAASYAICALIDETVMRTPWGATAGWGQQTVLSLIHGDTTGGERVFHLLNELTNQPGATIDALEVLYVCISLGFMGRFGAVDRGREQLDRIEQGLFQTIRAQRGEFERELSPQWRGLTDKRPRVAKLVPLWVVWAGALGIMTLILVGFNLALNASSDAAFGRLAQLGRERPAAAIAAPQPQPQTLVSSPGPSRQDRIAGVRQALAPDLSSGAVQLLTDGPNLTLRVPGQGLFASGSAQLTGPARALVDRVGRAVGDLPGPIVVAGHTDDQPIRTLRYPSNWHLSTARAQTVVAAMRGYADPPSKLIAEGRADQQPIADNDTAEGRAQNRRIDIELTIY